MENTTEMMDQNIVKSKLTLEKYSQQSIIQLIVESLQSQQDFNCLIDSTSKRKWTKKQVLDSCLNVAYYLIKECKLIKGDIVCFITNNNDIHAIGLLGVLAAGGVYCSLPRHTTQTEISSNMMTIKPTILIGNSDNFTLLTKMGQQFDCIKTILLLNEFCANKLHIKSQSIERALELIRDNDIELPVMSGLSDMATLVMSSGSSGTPKAIIRTNRNLLAIVAITQHPEICPLRADDIMLSTGFNHMCGQRSLFSSLTSGAQLVVWGDDHSNEAIFDGIHDMNVTNIFTVPTELNFLIKNQHKYNKTYLKTLRDVFCGGAFLSQHIYQQICDLFSFQRFRNHYGMSECGWVTNVYISESKCVPNVETIGKVNPGVEIKIIDNLENSLPPNSIGQICIRGDNVVPGYFGYCGNFVHEHITNDGFFKTGDLAYYDKNEYFYFIDRCKDVINFNSIIVSPVELEKVLLFHESVVNAAVIGVEDEDNGEIPMGFVTIKSGAQVEEQELMDYVNNRVNRIKQMRGGVKIVKALPLTPLGKVKKADIKRMIKNGDWPGNM